MRRADLLIVLAVIALIVLGVATSTSSDPSPKQITTITIKGE